MFDGLVKLPLFVTDIVFVPIETGVYTKVPVGLPLEIETVLGVNVPPAPESEGVTIIVPLIVPSAPIVKLVDATDTVPLDGPVIVILVALLPVVVVNGPALTTLEVVTPETCTTST